MVDSFKSILVYFSILAIISCQQVSNENENKIESPRKQERFPDSVDGVLMLKKVMVDKTSCYPGVDFKETKRQDLYGKWKDSLSWVSNEGDTCWYGVDNIDSDVYIEFFKNRKFVRTEIIQKVNYIKIDSGHYFIENINDTTRLTLIENWEKTKPGDTVMADGYLLWWREDGMFLLDPLKYDSLIMELPMFRRMK